MRAHPLRVKKRGAIELSMTTIVVVVIGITILTLGLRWIYNIFGGLESQRQKLIEATEEQIRNTFGNTNEPLNLLTSAISVQQNGFYDLGVAIKNTMGERHDFVYTVEPTDYLTNIQKTQVLSWFRWDKSTLRLDSGQFYTDVISIDPKSAPLGVYKLRFTLTCLDCGTPTTNNAPLTMRIASK